MSAHSLLPEKELGSGCTHISSACVRTNSCATPAHKITCKWGEPNNETDQAAEDLAVSDICQIAAEKIVCLQRCRVPKGVAEVAFDIGLGVEI